MIRHLRYSTVSVPHLYEESFKKAMLTFQHQRIYDPITEDIVHLSRISNDMGDDLDFLGPYPLFGAYFDFLDTLVLYSSSLNAQDQ